MRRISGDVWLVLGLLVLLITVASLAALWEGEQEATLPDMASFSSQPTGTRALRLWIEELGYTAGDRMPGRFQPPEEADLLLMLEPDPGITEGEWEIVDEWVEAGGTLVVSGADFGSNLALRRYDATLDLLPPTNAATVTPAPLLNSPPLERLTNARVSQSLELEREDAQTLLSVNGQPVMVTFSQGAGRVVLSTLDYPLTNAGLKEAGNAELALNLISLAPPSGTIWFDEWHHGIREGAPLLGPGNWLRGTPAGRALLYTAIILFVALVLRGRLFGRPLTLPERTVRRAPLEHISAVAALSHRAHHQRAVADFYRQELKRHLAARFRLDPGLPDAEFVQQLGAYNPQIDTPALADLLNRLSRPTPSDSELLACASEVNAWLGGRSEAVVSAPGVDLPDRERRST